MDEVITVPRPIHSRNTSVFPLESLAKIEEHYGAEYVCDYAIKLKGGRWSASHWPIFYVAAPDTEKGHSHWIQLFYNSENQLIITNADWIISHQIAAVIDHDDQLLFSRSVHDFVAGSGCAIDGGPDYTRIVGSPKEQTTLLIMAPVTETMIEEETDETVHIRARQNVIGPPTEASVPPV